MSRIRITSIDRIDEINPNTRAVAMILTPAPDDARFVNGERADVPFVHFSSPDRLSEYFKTMTPYDIPRETIEDSWPRIMSMLDNKRSHNFDPSTF